MNFDYTEDSLHAIVRSVSRDRLDWYINQSDGSVADAIRLYELNTRLSATFYGLVQGLEVLVRNVMNEQLVARFGIDWHDLTLVRFDVPQQIEVRSAIAVLENSPTNGAIVAKLPLGFWAALLNSSNDVEIWRKALWKAFPHRPKGIERKTVHGALSSFRRLRNRIAHHEKILHRDLIADQATILEIAGWCCPVTRDWIASLSTFDPDMLPVAEAELPLDMPTMPDTPRPPQPTREERPRLGLRNDDPA